jgi:hypothetical protein
MQIIANQLSVVERDSDQTCRVRLASPEIPPPATEMMVMRERRRD